MRGGLYVLKKRALIAEFDTRRKQVPRIKRVMELTVT
jgi:hypothetical protein